MEMTPEELAELMDCWNATLNTPVIAMSVKDGLEGNDFQSQAQRRFADKWIEICSKYGLQHDKTGFNSLTGEFVK